MQTSPKDTFAKAFQQNSDSAIRRGIIKKFDKLSYTATVQFNDGGQTTTPSVPVSRDIPSRVIKANTLCAFVSFDPNNPRDGFVVAVYSGAGGQPNFSHQYTDTTVFSTPVNDVTTWSTVTNMVVQLNTGPGTVLVHVDGGFFLAGATGGGSAKVRIKATLSDTSTGTVVTNPVAYYPNVFGRVLFMASNNSYWPYSWNWPIDVPEGVQKFELQVRGNSLISGMSVDLDSNGVASITASEL